MTTRELFGTRGIKLRGRRWCLDRYPRGTHAATLPPWFAGWVTETPGDKRVGVEVCGPRHGLALFHTGDTA